MRWFNTHWRAAHIICLDFQGYPFTPFPEIDWEAPASDPAPGSARVLRVMCEGPYGEWYGTWLEGPAQDDLVSVLPRWVAGVAPLCQNLTGLHLRGMRAEPLPALAPARARHPGAVHVHACAGRLAPGSGEAGDAARERRIGPRAAGVGYACLNEVAQGAHWVDAGQGAGCSRPGAVLATRLHGGLGDPAGR